MALLALFTLWPRLLPNSGVAIGTGRKFRLPRDRVAIQFPELRLTIGLAEDWLSPGFLYSAKYCIASVQLPAGRADRGERQARVPAAGE